MEKKPNVKSASLDRWSIDQAAPDSPIRAATGANGEDIDHLLARSSIEEDAPLSDAESPEALRSAEAFDVAVGKLTDR
jgi:hypothetical protein